MSEWDVEDFRRLFPALYEEMTRSKPIKVKVDVLRGYTPTVTDYLARCPDEESALEVIDYLERRGEIGPEQANELRERIRREGVRSIVEMREEGYYLRKYGTG
ncbi:MAG: DUF2095 family protein [Nitrososphaerota archaeon]|nr:DUF2095 family protein [Candidatus Calditenuis fumarioli]